MAPANAVKEGGKGVSWDKTCVIYPPLARRVMGLIFPSHTQGDKSIRQRYIPSGTGSQVMIEFSFLAKDRHTLEFTQ